jgi:L-ascorbate metabolism protein UlaG (beta-lactamase superfamily)
MKKVVKMIGYGILGLIGLVTITGVLFVTKSPQFGANPTEEEKAQYERFSNYQNGIFNNLIPTEVDFNFKDFSKMTYRYITGKEQRKPKHEPPIEKINREKVIANTKDFGFSWFGHSTFFMKIADQNILIDPMFSEVPAPHPSLGGKRFNKQLPLVIDSLPNIDLVLISHDHYDHLDYESINALKQKVSKFYVPFGIGAHLRSWGIDEEKIQEFNWWSESEYKGLNIVFTPARHFSGRGLNNRFSTLWGSWVIQSENENIFFSGDSGYGPHFKDIGDKYGPFDISFMECGQYNELWSNIHMMPEETVQAAIDSKSKVMMPIHWGAFSLAMHDWNEPIIRANSLSKKLNIPLIAPKIGAWVELNNIGSHIEEWWK